MDVEQQVRAFVTTNFYVANPAALSEHASLLELGIIDSTGVLEIVSFLEGNLGVRVEDFELLPDNLDSIARISTFVMRKLSDAETATVPAPPSAIPAALGQ